MDNKSRFLLRASLVVLTILWGGGYLNSLAKNANNASASPPSSGMTDSEGYRYFLQEVLPVLNQHCFRQDKQGNAVCHITDSSAQDKKISPAVPTPNKAPRHSLSAEAFQSCEKCHQKSRKELLGEAPTPPRPLALDYESALKLALHDKAPFSKLLRTPLAALAGGFGLLHKGGEVFRDTASSDYQKLLHWVNMENENAVRQGRAQVTITPAEQFFAEQVLPVFVRRSCFAPSCHIFNHGAFFLDPGTPSENLSVPIAERFSREQVKFNRMAAKGLIQHVVYLTGDVELSRVLKKNIPLEKGGVLHKGGNNQFFNDTSAPDYQIVKRWLELEREEALAPLKIDGKPVDKGLVGKVRGVVFVRTPSHNHRHYLDVGKYLPGGDLFLLKLEEGETLATAKGKPINLTARFHIGKDADVREPDVRYDGRAIIFAMRIGEEDNLNIYEILLDENLDYLEGSFRRLTYGPKFVNGIEVHYTDPTFVPDPLDQNAALGGYNLDRADIVFASNIAGVLVPSIPRGILGEADGGDEETIIDLDRPEKNGTFVGRKIHIVAGSNKGEWRYIEEFTNNLFDADIRRSFLKVDRPFPQPIDSSSLYVIEELPELLPGFLPSYSVYGMKYPPRGKEEWIYEQTLSRITHGFAQEMDLSVRSTGEVFFSGQRSFVDKDGRPVFHMASCRRHLDTRFSFPTHYGNRAQIPILADNHELPTGIDIHAYLCPHTLWESGALGVSDHQLGPNLDPRNPNDFVTGRFDEDGYPLVSNKTIDNTRFTFTQGNFSHPRFLFSSNYMFPSFGPHAVSWTGFSPGGTFRDPTPLPDGNLLVSHYDKPIDLLDPNANPQFRLYLIEPAKSFQTPGHKGNPQVQKLALSIPSAVGYSDVQAKPIYVRMKERINAARRPKSEHLIRYPGEGIDTRLATYLERNYHLIDAIMNDPTPSGKNIASSAYGAIEPIDEVCYVRMVEVLPVLPKEAKKLDIEKIANRDPLSTLISNGIHLRKRILVEQPLGKDGSINIKVPSRTSLSIQSLNADKMALRQSARLYFFAPNELFTISPARSETFQTCGMCMGSITKNPDKLFGPSTLFSGQSQVEALSRKIPAEPLAYSSIDFVKDIQPIFDRSCVACHGDKTPAGGLTLQGTATAYYTKSYESLQQLEDPQSGAYHRKKYLSERNALAVESYLIEKLYGRELKAPRQLSGDYPHPSMALVKHRGVSVSPLTEEDKMLLVRWIDLGATFKGGE